jgi:hypothetical protein
MTYPSFASGDVLTAADMNAVGLWLVKTQTIGSAVASVAVTGAFSSTYDNYLIQVSGGVASVATAIGYYQAGQSLTFLGASVAASQNNVASWTSVGVGTTDSIMMDFNVYAPNLTKRTFMSARYIYGATTGGGDMSAYMGYHNVAAAYTDFTVIPGTGTLTGGTIRVYGYRN